MNLSFNWCRLYIISVSSILLRSLGIISCCGLIISSCWLVITLSVTFVRCWIRLVISISSISSIFVFYIWIVIILRNSLSRYLIMIVILRCWWYLLFKLMALKIVFLWSALNMLFLLILESTSSANVSLIIIRINHSFDWLA